MWLKKRRERSAEEGSSMRSSQSSLCVLPQKRVGCMSHNSG